MQPENTTSRSPKAVFGPMAPLQVSRRPTPSPAGMLGASMIELMVATFIMSAITLVAYKLYLRTSANEGEAIALDVAKTYHNIGQHLMEKSAGPPMFRKYAPRGTFYTKDFVTYSLVNIPPDGTNASQQITTKIGSETITVNRNSFNVASDEQTFGNKKRLTAYLSRCITEDQINATVDKSFIESLKYFPFRAACAPGADPDESCLKSSGQPTDSSGYKQEIECCKLTNTGALDAASCEKTATAASAYRPRLFEIRLDETTNPNGLVKVHPAADDLQYLSGMTMFHYYDNRDEIGRNGASFIYHLVMTSYNRCQAQRDFHQVRGSKAPATCTKLRKNTWFLFKDLTQAIIFEMGQDGTIPTSY